MNEDQERELRAINNALIKVEVKLKTMEDSFREVLKNLNARVNALEREMK